MDDVPVLQKQVSHTKDEVLVLGADDLRPELEKQLQKWYDTYYLDSDEMLIVARHYRWKEDRMVEWFSKTDTDQFNLGVKVKPCQD